MIKRFITLFSDIDQEILKDILWKIKDAMKNSPDENMVLNIARESGAKLYIMEIDDSQALMRISSISEEGVKIEDFKPQVKEDGWVELK